MLKLNAILISICFIVFDDCACDDECKMTGIDLELLVVNESGNNILEIDTILLTDSSVLWLPQGQTYTGWFERDTINQVLSLFLTPNDTVKIEMPGYQPEIIFLTDYRLGPDASDCCPGNISSYVLNDSDEIICEWCIGLEPVELILKSK